MRRLSDCFAEAAGRCSDLPALGRLLDDVARDLGFHFFALLDHSSLATEDPGLVRLDNYPEGWVAELLATGWAADDPVHLASRRTNVGFGWCELGRLIPLERRHRRILARSRHFGLGGGFTVPANVPGEPSASCSFAVRAGWRDRCGRRGRGRGSAGASFSAFALSRLARPTGRSPRSSASASRPRANM